MRIKQGIEGDFLPDRIIMLKRHLLSKITPFSLT